MKIIYSLITIIVLILIGFFLYEKFAYLNISVKFEDLDPFDNKMNVYYKGFKIGKTAKMYADKDYSNTYLELKIKPKKINLPENITADLKMSGDKPYVKILYPSSPAVKRIAKGAVIEGKAEKDINSIINETLNGENVQDLMGNASNLIENANNTVISLGKIFDEVNGILQDARPSIKASVNNIEKATTHLANVSGNLDNALGRTTTKNSINNIEESTNNLKQMTENLNNITEQIDEVSMPEINSILCETNNTMKNTNEITNGIKCTLKKHLGLMKLFFGKPVSNCNSCDTKN